MAHWISGRYRPPKSPKCPLCLDTGSVPGEPVKHTNGATYPNHRVVCVCRDRKAKAQAPAKLDHAQRAAGERDEES
jgi:hypothetical protein